MVIKGHLQDLVKTLHGLCFYGQLLSLVFVKILKTCNLKCLNHNLTIVQFHTWSTNIVKEPISFSNALQPQSNISTDVSAAYSGATLRRMNTCVISLTQTLYLLSSQYHFWCLWCDSSTVGLEPKTSQCLSRYSTTTLCIKSGIKCLNIRYFFIQNAGPPERPERINPEEVFKCQGWNKNLRYTNLTLFLFINLLIILDLI